MKGLLFLVALLEAADAAPQIGLTFSPYTPKGFRPTPKSTSPRSPSKSTPRNTWPAPEPFTTSTYSWTTAYPRTTSIQTWISSSSKQVPPPRNQAPPPSPTAIPPVSGPDRPPPPPVSAEPKGPTCKNIPGDPAWPGDDIWKAELPGVVQVQQKPDEPHPNYHYSARNHGDVQAAVNFAIRHNVRLSVINTGHDFLGRNDAPTGLGLSVDKLKGVFVHQDFKPSLSGAREINFAAHPIKGANVIKADPFKQSFVTFGAGVTGQELHNALEPSKLFNLGGAHGKVSIAGGWGLAGGHGPLTSSYGLGVDQVVEYQVVTPDGRLRIANSVSEPDLFWALRGGGGGTFGIVVQATIIVYPSPKITVARWWINTTDTSPNSNAVYEPAAYLHSLFPRLNAAKGVQGYYYIFPNAIQGIFLANGLDSGTDKAKSTWAPILAAMTTFKGMGTPIAEYTDYPSYKTFFDAAFGPLEKMNSMAKRGFMQQADDHFYGLFKRHGPGGDADDMNGVDTGAAPSGIVPMDSRLLDRAALTSDKLAKALEDAMPKLKNGMLRGHLVAGSAVNLDNEGTSVNPAWRRAYVHIIGTGVGVPNIQSLKSLTPDMGAYSNECLWREKDWKRTFWGSNYQRLSLIKSEIDPYGILYVSPGINADHFAVRDGRLCRKVPFVAANDMVPAGDSTTIGKHAEDGNDLVVPWPKDQADADAYAKSEKEKFGALTALSSKSHEGAATSAASSVTPIINYPGAKDSSTTFKDASSKATIPAPAATIPSPKSGGLLSATVVQPIPTTATTPSSAATVPIPKPVGPPPDTAAQPIPTVATIPAPQPQQPPPASVPQPVVTAPNVPSGRPQGPPVASVPQPVVTAPSVPSGKPQEPPAASIPQPAISAPSVPSGKPQGPPLASVPQPVVSTPAVPVVKPESQPLVTAPPPLAAATSAPAEPSVTLDELMPLNDPSLGENRS